MTVTGRWGSQSILPYKSSMFWCLSSATVRLGWKWNGPEDRRFRIIQLFSLNLVQWFSLFTNGIKLYPPQDYHSPRKMDSWKTTSLLGARVDFFSGELLVVWRVPLNDRKLLHQHVGIIKGWRPSSTCLATTWALWCVGADRPQIILFFEKLWLVLFIQPKNMKQK